MGLSCLPFGILFLLVINTIPSFVSAQITKSDYTNVREYEIGGITVTGSKYLNEEIIIKFSRLNVGDRITIPGDDISDAIRQLWRQELFANVSIYATQYIGDKIFLNIELQERPRLSKYSIKGVKKSESEDLRDAMKLIRGKVVTENLKIQAVSAIRKFYVNKGFLDVKVNLTETNDSLPNSVILEFDIKKGNKVKVNTISFIGNNYADTRKLKHLMKNTKEVSKVTLFRDIKKKLSSLDTYNPIKLPERVFAATPKKVLNYFRDHFQPRIFTASRYLKKDFKEDLDRVIAYYNSIGYRDAYIVKDTNYLNADNNINIIVTIDEGRKYYFGNITWKGNVKYSDEELDKILSIKPGMIYDQDLLESKLGIQINPNGAVDVSSLYMDEGHLFFNITPIEIAVENDSIDIEINIYEGPVATINRVTITGNTQTSEHVIRRELRTIPGNKFSRSDIIRSQRQIASLGFFDPEQMGITPTPHPENGTVDIEYRVAEKPSSQLEMSMGWGGNGLVGTAGVSFNNFSTKNIFNRELWNPLPSGDGQTLSLRVQSNASFFQSYTASFTEPWLGGKKANSFTVSLYRNVTNYSGVTARQQKKDPTLVRQAFNASGLTFSLGKRLKFPDDYFTLQSALNLQVYELDNFANFVFKNGVANNFSIEETLSRISIDQPLYPRNGSKISLSLQATLPYSYLNITGIDYNKPELSDQEKYKWVEYHKWKLTAEWFTPLTNNKNTLVLRTEAKLGFLGFYNDKIGISPFERFQLGGDGISNNNFLLGRDIVAQRGYDAPPLSDPGAPVFNKYTLELRYPLSLNPTSTIFVTGFVQGANAWQSIKDYSPFQLRRSFGLGLRLYLPMFGLLGFDYGVGIDKNLPPAKNFGDLLSRYGKFNIVLGFEPQ